MTQTSDFERQKESPAGES